MKFTYIGNQENKEVKVTGSYANGAYETANAAYGSQNTTATYANAAFVYANAAFSLANTGGSATDQYARDTANGAFIQANAAYGQANTATTNASTADSKAVTAGVYANSSYTQANTATTNASTADSKAVTAGVYANAAYSQANTATTNASTADSKAVTSGEYANAAYSQANTATTNASTADSKAVSAGTYANGAFIQANASFNKANSVLSGFKSNTVLVTNSAGYVVNSNVEFSSSNNTLYTINANVSNELAANTIVFYDGTRLNSSTGIAANTANSALTANVTVYARVTNVTTGTYYPIVTDTTITGSDTLHYSSQDFLMFASNNTFRSSGNVWAGENIVVGANIPVVNATGYWTGQPLSATDSTARTIASAAYTQANTATTNAATADSKAVTAGVYANSAFTTANNALPKAGGIVTGNLMLSSAATMRIQNTATTTSNNTGALIIDGGLAVKGNTWISGIFTVDGDFQVGNQNTSGNVYNTGTVTFIQPTLFTSNASTTSNTTGAIIVTGGAGIKGNVYSGSIRITGSSANNITFDQGTTQIGSSSILAQDITATGNLVISGTGGDISNANTVFANVVSLTTSAIVAGLNVVPYLQSSFAQANTATNNAAGASLYANAAYTQANTATTNASTADSKAVTAGVYANSAYTQANTATNNASNGSLYANASFIQANAAFAAANAGGAGTDSFARNTANASFIQANAAFAAANVGGTDQYARNTANAALAAANSAGTGLLIYNNFFTANGNTSTFNLSTSPETEDFTFVNIDGVLQLKSTYSITGNTVILSENVPANSNVEITVLGGANLDQYSRNVANAAYAQANTDFTNITITSPGTYGNATYVPVITVTSNGRINTISTIAITGGGGGGSDPAAGNTANAAFIQANAAFNAANTTTSNNASTLSGVIVPLANTSDQFNILGITGNINIYDPAGTPTEGQKLIIRIKDAGTSVNLSWNVIYRSIGVNLPSITVANKTAYIGFVYNTTDTKWDAVAVSLQG